MRGLRGDFEGTRQDGGMSTQASSKRTETQRAEVISGGADEEESMLGVVTRRFAWPRQKRREPYILHSHTSIANHVTLASQIEKYTAADPWSTP